MQEVYCAIFSEVQATIIPAVLPAPQTTTTIAAAVIVAATIQVRLAAVGEVHPSVSFKRLPNLSVIWRKGYSKHLLSLIYDS